MNNKIILLLMSGVVSSASWAADVNWQPFISLNGGYQLANDDNYHHTEPRGAILGVRAGLQLTQPFSVGFGYQYDDTLTAKASDVDIATWLLDVSARYDYYLTPNISLYGRLGVAHWNTEKRNTISAVSVRDNGFSPLSEIGVNYSLNSNIKFNAGYQYINGIGSSKIGNYDSHAVMLGVSYVFGENKVNVLLTPPSLPQKPDVQSEYRIEAPVPFLSTVTFALNSAQISDAMSTIVDDAAQRVKAHPSATVEITGNTDNTGSKAYNQDLAERRAKSVMSRLLKQGVDASHITLKNNVDNDPVASNETEAGRAENRRADISIINLR